MKRVYKTKHQNEIDRPIYNIERDHYTLVFSVDTLSSPKWAVKCNMPYGTDP